MPSETRYAIHNGAHIAYRVTGEGPIDIIIVQGQGHVDIIWESPIWSRFAERLSAFARLVIFDKLGTGLSDPVSLTSPPTLEHWMDEVRTVMDAIGSTKAAIVANFEGGPAAILFAATYPERTTALVLIDSFARLSRADDYPAGIPKDSIDRFVEAAPSVWGTGMSFDWLAPSHARDTESRELTARFERASASPGAFSAIIKVNVTVDVRNVLPLVSAPTLILNRKDNQWIRAGHSRYLAEHIPGAKHVELPGIDTYIAAGDANAVVAEIQEFLTGMRPAVDTERVLATVFFTDIVDSTKRAIELGDRKWREMLEEHHRIVRAELATFKGREIKTTGDGFLAIFDGPARAIQCAHSLVHRLKRTGIEIRAGLHTGECELMGEDVGGIAVHVGARICALATPGEILVSGTVTDLVAGSGIIFADKGEYELKGVEGATRLYAVV